MRRAVFFMLPLLIAGPVAAADCSKDVATAFQKQHAAKGFRVEFSQPTAEGEAHMQIDYVLPDKMLQTVTSPAMPGEQQTMLVGNRAYAGTSGAYEELLPQYTQSIVAEFNEAVGPLPKDLTGFECLGETKFDNASYLAFRTVDKGQAAADPSKSLARTIYVDASTGLPAYNVVAALAGNADPVMKVKYSYPTDVEIIAPENAPVQKIR